MSSSIHPTTAERFFFYWQHSSTLWENNLRNYLDEQANTSYLPLFIPLNWAFHQVQTPLSSSSELSYDFGQEAMETNLTYLINLALSLNLNPILLVPLTPVPYLANGGVPSSIAKILCKNPQGLINAVATTDHLLNKMFSFYDPKIYWSYSKFLKKLREHLLPQANNISVAAMGCGYNLDGRFITYLDDSSSAFEEGLLKYKAQSEQNSHAYAFQKTVKNLYLQLIKEAFKDNWVGELSFSFLLSSPLDILVKASCEFHLDEYIFQDAITALVQKSIPSAALLSSEALENRSLSQIFKELSTPEFYASKLDGMQTYESEHISFSIMHFFEIYELPSHQTSLSTGVLPYL
ncbi:MAG: hypothetical protein HQK50_07310, partial [Oligoflexia bacterium]|nr:hypothetical protein [Oligoflexia bacterium]